MPTERPGPPEPSPKRQVGGRGGALSGADAAAFAGQLAGLVGAGLPLPAGLRALGEELPSGRLSHAFDDLSGRLEAGATLEEAVAAQGRRLPAHLRGLIVAGARTGKLGEMIGRFVDSAHAGAQIRRRIWAGLAYPALLLGSAVALFVFACFAIIEGFRNIFADFGLSLPAATRMVIGASSTVVKLNWRALPALGGLVAVAWGAERLLLGASQRRRLACEIPLVGPLMRWTALAEFSRVLGLLIRGEVPLPEAVRLAGEAVHDPDLADAGRSIAAEVEGGRSLSESLGGCRRFPEGYAKLVGWAEGNRALPEALDILGEMYEAKARAHASTLGSLGGAAALILVLGGTALVVLALVLPLVNLLNSLTGW